MSPGTDVDALRGGRAVELVGTDREAGLEVLDAEVARDVEQHRAADDALRARWCTPSRRAPPVAVTSPAQYPL